jgi:hypothetical protein
MARTEEMNRSTYVAKRLEMAKDAAVLSGNMSRVLDLTPSMKCRACSTLTHDRTNFRSLDATDHVMPTSRFCDAFCFLHYRATTGQKVIWSTVKGWFQIQAQKQTDPNGWLQKQEHRWMQKWNELYFPKH